MTDKLTHHQSDTEQRPNRLRQGDRLLRILLSRASVAALVCSIGASVLHAWWVFGCALVASCLTLASALIWRRSTPHMELTLVFLAIAAIFVIVGAEFDWRTL